MTKQLKTVPMTNGIPADFIEPADAILTILNLWLDWVENHDEILYDDGYEYCFFCGKERFPLIGIEDHEDDCIYNLTKEYVKQLCHRPATKDKPCSCYD